MGKINLLEYFEDTVRRLGEKTAVLDGERAGSFRELRQEARALGCALRRKTGGEPGRPAAVYLKKSAGSIAADLAVLYAGCAYLNLDVDTPLPRTRKALELVEPLAVITDRDHAPALRELWPQERTLLLEEARPPAPAEEAAMDAGLRGLIDTDLFCLINTSGSTGTPKSVALCHRSFIDYTTWAIEALGLREEEVLGSLAPIVFDHFSYELCLMMALGCTLDLIPEGCAAFPPKLLQHLARREVTYIFWVPTIMVNIANLDLLSRIPLPRLRMVWFAGEVFPTKQFNYWRRHLPGATFVNLYGPTEITVDCTYFVVDREIPDQEPIPIGFPRRNADVLILREGDLPAGPGEEGELCVRGSCLALGYYNNPEKTAEAFVQNPLNRAYPERVYRTGDMVFRNERGEIVFKGRRDSLIKHAGNRIELGEIEHTAVNALGLVENGCAVYDGDRREIVFFYEAREELPPARFRRALLEVLPGYMVPGRFIRMEQLPRNQNGKIDRLALKKRVNP